MAPLPNEAYGRFVSSLNRSEPQGHVVFVLFNVYRGPLPGTRYLHNTHDPDGRPRRSFVDARVPIFCRYTLRSLANQTSDNFVVGLMYERTTDWKKGQLESLSREARTKLAVPFELAPIDAIDFTRNYERGFWARRRSEEAVVARHHDPKKPLLVTYLDGDDLLHERYVERCQAERVPSNTQVICFPQGYMYQPRGGKIRPWWRPNHRVQPPFFTLRYARAQDFLDGKRLDGGPGRHLYVAQRLKSVSVRERLWAQNCHGANDSTAYGAPPSSPELGRKQADQVLRALGMSAD